MAINFLQRVGGFISGAYALLVSRPGGGVVFSSAFAVRDVPPGNISPPGSVVGPDGAVSGYSFVDLAAGAPVPSPALASPSISGVTTYTPFPSQTTTDGSTITLWQMQQPANGKQIALRYSVQAVISGDATHFSSAYFERVFLCYTNGAGSPQSIEHPYDLLGDPFTTDESSLVAGDVRVTGSGTTLSIQAKGIATTAWSSSGVLPAGFVSNGGKIYYLATGGTDNGSGSGPTGTGFSQTVGGVTYGAYIGAAPVTISWTLTDVEMRGPVPT